MDRDALARAVQDGHIAGYAGDVYVHIDMHL